MGPAAQGTLLTAMIKGQEGHPDKANALEAFTCITSANIFGQTKQCPCLSPVSRAVKLHNKVCGHSVGWEWGEKLNLAQCLLSSTRHRSFPGGPVYPQSLSRVAWTWLKQQRVNEWIVSVCWGWRADTSARRGVLLLAALAPPMAPYPPRVLYSCLENSMDRGSWWVTVHGVTGLDIIEHAWTWFNISWKAGLVVLNS